jgi:type VI secretion system protein ImpA
MSDDVQEEETDAEAPAKPPPSVAEDAPDEALLAGLDGDNPCGENLRYEGTFDRIREARRDEDPALPQGIWETEIKRADWPAVARMCETALAEKSKDLHLALWLTEAWTHIDGLPGFRRGLDLTSSLLEEFWPTIHPEIDEDGDLDYRLGPVRWAADQFPAMLRLVPVTAPTGGETRAMRLKDWEDVLRLENLRQRDAAAAKREQDRLPSRNDVESSVELTPIGHFEALAPVTEACLLELERLDLIMEEHCPKDAPSLGKVRDVLRDLDTRTRAWITQRGGVLPEDRVEAVDEDGADRLETPDAESASAEPPRETQAMPSDTAAPAGPIQSRAEAYRRLSEAADYLLIAEPHSPVPYLVKRAVDWGNLSFGELLVELMEGGGDHQRVLRLLGLDEMGKKKG